MHFPYHYNTKQIADHKVIHVNLSDSTNQLMVEFIEYNGMHDGLVIQTDFQSAGRGMMGSSWESEDGQNLLFSLCIDTQGITIQDQFYISKLVALSVVNGLNNFLNQDACRIKWPNDILIQDKKICGILIQNSLKEDRLQYAIAGIGINVNQSSFASNTNAFSLSNYMGRSVQIDEVLNEVMKEWNIYSSMLRPIDKKAIDLKYHDILYGLDTWMPFTNEHGKFKGKILEVISNGKLRLETETGEIVEYDLKEISLDQGS